jgi:hypothetical protein
MEFAIAADLMPEDEIEEMEMVLKVMKQGIMPPPCRGEAECDAYCSEPEHFEECITFAEAAGFMTPEEVKMARKTGGKGPGNCHGEAECDAYCQDPANMEECINFALEYDLMPPEEAERARKALELGLFLGSGPGGCMSEEECDAYCQDPVNIEECIDLAVKMGDMTEKDAEMARRAGGKGPGGCITEEECNAFCDDPANMDECIDFSVRIGDMTSEQAEQARQGAQMLEIGTPGNCQSEAECDAYCQNPAHMKECIMFSVETGRMSLEEAESILQMMEMMDQGGSGMMGPEPEHDPQSFFDQAKDFLASVAAAFGF